MDIIWAKQFPIQNIENTLQNPAIGQNVYTENKKKRNFKFIKYLPEILCMRYVYNWVGVFVCPLIIETCHKIRKLYVDVVAVDDAGLLMLMCL